jgi:WD40 repeat protein
MLEPPARPTGPADATHVVPDHSKGAWLMTLSRTGLLALCLILPLVPTAQSETPAQEQPAPAVDRHGDPLPRHVVGRLGTIRFRHGSPVATLRFAPDGKTLVSAGNDQSLRMWDVKNGRELQHLAGGQGPGEPGGDLIIEDFKSMSSNRNGWVLSPDARMLAVMESIGSVKLVDTATRKQLHRLGDAQNRGNNASMAFSPDGKLFAAIGNENKNNMYYGVVRLWDTKTGKEVRALAGPVPKMANEQRFYPNNVTFSPDGKMIVSVGYEGRRGEVVHLWEVESGKVLPDLMNPTDKKGVVDLIGGLFDRPEYRNMAGAPIFSPDGKMLAGVYQTNRGGAKLRLWDPLTGKHLRDLGNQPNGVNFMVFSPDGLKLAVVQNDQTVHLWDPATGKELPALGGATGSVQAVVWSADGTGLAVGGSEQTIQLYDALGKDTHKLKGYQGNHGPQNLYNMGQGLGSSIAFSPDGQTVAAAAGSMVRLWTVATGQEIDPVTEAHSGAVIGVAASPDGKTVATASEDKTVRLWDTTTGRELRRMDKPADEAAGGFFAYYNNSSAGGVNLAFSPDGKTLAAAQSNGSIQLWTTDTGKALPKLKGHNGSMPSLAFAPNGKALASGGTDGKVFWWDVKTGKQLRQFAGAITGGDDDPGVAFLIDRGSNPGSITVAISPDGKTLAAAGQTGLAYKIRMWELTTGKLRREIPVRTDTDEGSYRWRFGYMANNMSGATLTFAPDSKVLAWSSGSTIRLWDPIRGKELRQFGGQESNISATAFSPDGKLLVAASLDSTVRVWNVASGTILTQVVGHRGAVNTLAFCIDGKTLASSGADTSVLLWNVPSAVAEARPAALSPEKLADLWNELADDSAAKALETIGKLAAAPEQSLPLLKERLKPAPALDQEKLKQLVTDLENERFAVRKKATDQLERLGQLAEQALTKRLEENPPLEVRQRIEQLLTKLKGFVTHPDAVRALRAVEVLEQIGTPAAQEALATVAKGAPEANLTQEAQAALDRLAKLKK